MTCPVCGEKTTVVYSRSDCESVRRRRRCLKCNYRFTTEEYEVEVSRKDWVRYEIKRNT